MEQSLRERAHARPATRKLIDDLMRERRQMLVLLSNLIKLNLYNVDGKVEAALEEFLTLLVDYIAAGHFGLYQRLVEGTERRQPVMEAAREALGSITASTDAAVRFSERYEKATPQLMNDHLATDLSSLAEQISIRVSLEDTLILAMLGEIPLTAPV
jgi:regulator of sigma D